MPKRTIELQPEGARRGAKKRPAPTSEKVGNPFLNKSEKKQRLSNLVIHLAEVIRNGRSSNPFLNTAEMDKRRERKPTGRK